MPIYGWKPEFNEPSLKKREWPPPPDISLRKTLKKSQLIKEIAPPKPRELSEEEKRILYERDIYLLYVRHASPLELQKQYNYFKDEKVSSRMVRAWLMHSYQGEANDNQMPDGEGAANMASGIYYKGAFKKGLLHGRGRLEWNNGSSYSGEFFYNHLLGKGIYNWVGGARYTGQIFNGLPHGQGKMEGPKGLVYEGRWQYGKRHGPGRMKYGNVGTYEGIWKDDHKHGEGRLVYGTGSSYHGTWHEGKRHGDGRQVQRIIPSKATINSHMSALEGRPDTIYAQCYEGKWLQGLPHGSGRSEWLWDGKKVDSSILINSYVGSYKNGMRHGPGCFYYASGAFYKGYWQENTKVGFGVLVYETGNVHFGIFHHDRYDPIPTPRLHIKEPLVSTINYSTEEEEDMAKLGMLRSIMRYKNALKDAFITYCSLVKNNLAPRSDTTLLEESVARELSKKPSKIKETKKPKLDKEGNTTIKAPKDGHGAKDDSKAKQNSSKKDHRGKNNKEKYVETSKEEAKADELPYEPAKKIKSEPESPRQGLAGRSRGISNEQFWRLLHDGHMLQAGLGLAEVDRMLPVTDMSWDNVSDVHSHNRELILREVIMALVQIALYKFQDEKISSEYKVERLFATNLQLLSQPDKDSWFAKVEKISVQEVLLNNMPILHRLFCELILESETSDYTIKLRSLMHFCESRRPEHDEPQGALLSKISRQLYHYEIKSPDDINKYLNHDINFREFEVILLIISTMGKDLKDKDGNPVEIAKLLKDFIVEEVGASKSNVKAIKITKGKGKKLDIKKGKGRKPNPEWVK